MTEKKPENSTALPDSDSRSALASKVVFDRTRTKARIEDAHIVWDPPNGFASGHGAEPPDRLVYDFAGLTIRTDEQLLRFAGKYGPLHLCKHGYALGHRQGDFNTRCYELDTGYEDLAPGQCFRLKWLARESIEAWRRYIRRAAGILTVTDRLHGDKRANQDEWSWLLDGTKEGLLASNPLIVALAAQPHRTLRDQRKTLAFAVNHWLDECGVGISIAWPQSGLDFRLGPSNPFGLGHSSLLTAIGVQLLYAVLRQARMFWCSDCGGPYPPKRWPRDGENHFCEDCGTKAAAKFAAREYRERQRRKSQ